MLHLNDLTYRVEGRLLFDKATAAISAGHKVGIVGRNGSGKTTLLRLILGELQPDAGGIRLPRATRIGFLAQEAPGGPESLLEFVLAADTERTRLLAEAPIARDPARIAEIHERLNHIEAHAAPSRAARILAGLGFDEAAQGRSCAELSGGWRMRVALAATLFAEPELLLLDEPTNYLDLEGALWLEDYLARYRHTVLIVSHERELLNRAVDSILHVAQGKLTLYSGGYDRFEEARRAKQRLDLKLKKKQDDERRHIEAFIARFKAKASKASQAQSRIKALARMQPIAGKRYASSKIAVGYFAQHQMEDLPVGKTPYQHMLDSMPDASEAQRRARLGRLGFGIGKADTKAQDLSGGEKARLLLALATFHGPHLMILDEPTNHLDVDAREALVRALNDYAGAVLIISHDRHLLDACADRLWIVRDGTVRPFEGDIDQYRAQCLAERGADPDARPAKAKAVAGRPTAQDARRQAAQSRADLAPLKKAVTTAETEIEHLSKRIEAIDRDLAEGALYQRNPARAQALARERGGLLRARTEAEARWLAADAAYEDAKARAQGRGLTLLPS